MAHRDVSSSADGWELHIRNSPQYDAFDDRGCAGRNELYIGHTSLADCAAGCDADSSCLSIEYDSDDGKCHRSNSCTYAHSTTGSSEWKLYIKIQ